MLKSNVAWVWLLPQRSRVVRSEPWTLAGTLQHTAELDPVWYPEWLDPFHIRSCRTGKRIHLKTLSKWRYHKKNGSIFSQIKKPKVVCIFKCLTETEWVIEALLRSLSIHPPLQMQSSFVIATHFFTGLIQTLTRIPLDGGLQMRPARRFPGTTHPTWVMD